MRPRRQRIVPLVAVFSIGLVSLAAPSAAGAVEGHAAVLWDGSAGGWVGQGVEGVFTSSDPDTTVSATGFASAVTFHVESEPARQMGRATVGLAAARGERLAPGAYEGAQRIGFGEDGRPGISVAKDSNGCNTETGRFVVHEAVFSVATGEVERFAATVEHRCDDRIPLFLDLRYNSSRPMVTRQGGPRVLGFMAADDTSKVERAVSVRAVGDASLEVGTATIAGADGARFAILTDTCSQAWLDPGEECSLEIEFSAADGAEKSATLRLPDNSPNGGRQWSLQAGVSPADLYLPQLPPAGQAAPTTALVVDATDQNPTGQEAVIFASDPGVDLRVTGGLTGVMIDLQSQDPARRPRSMTVTLAPAQGDWFEGGDYLGATRTPFREGPHPGIDISSDGFGCNQTSGAFSVHEIGFGDDGRLATLAASWVFSCAGPEPKAVGEIRFNSAVPFSARRVTPSRLDFGGSDGTPVRQSLTVTSTGNTSLEVGDAVVVERDDVFTVADDRCSGSILAPAESCTVTIEYQPVARGTDQGLVFLPDSTANFGRLLPLIGFGSGPGLGPPGEPVDPGDDPADDDWYEEERSGYWMLGATGSIFSFGDAAYFGAPSGTSAANIAPSPWGDGYWILSSDGAVSAYGDADHFGDRPRLRAGETTTSISPTPDGTGYWLFSSHGRAFAYGSARHFGDMSGTALNGPVLGSVSTPSGNGYYMVASDGGVFAFGDARFRGSMGRHRLNAPVRGLTPDPDGIGYWLVASDGGIFAFDAPFLGSMGGRPLNKPVVGMVSYGDGYLLVGSDGGIFNFSSKPFAGSLGANPPRDPIVAVAPLNG